MAFKFDFGDDSSEEVKKESTLTKDTLDAAFQCLSELIQKDTVIEAKHHPIIIYTIGGSVFVNFFRSRDSTHDVDITLWQVDRKISGHLENLMALVPDLVKGKLGSHINIQSGWMNTGPQYLLPDSNEQGIIQKIEITHITLYQSNYLKVQSYPLEYTVLNKLDRFSDTDQNDIKKVISHLQEKHAGRYTRLEEVWQWIWDGVDVRAEERMQRLEQHPNLKAKLKANLAKILPQ